MNKVYIIIMSLALTVSVSAQSSFRTVELERLATILSLDVKTLSEGYSHPQADGHRLTVHTMGHTIDHIGINLFNDQLRIDHPSPVFNFLERYFLQLKYPQKVKTPANMNRDDQFVFVYGSLADINNILPTDDFIYSRDNHRYSATWSRKGMIVLSVTFPVEYELMSGENKIEAENNLQTDIQSTEVNYRLPQLLNDQTTVIDATYISDVFSNRLYIVDSKLVASEKHPAETAANMMLSLQAAADNSLVVTQFSYSFQQTVFTVPLRQWISFCRNQGCELYFGLESIGNAGDVNATVLAVNEAENYNHVMTVCIPAKCIAGQRSDIAARLYPYVPTHNVLNMFAAYQKSNPKTFVSK